MSFSRMNSKFLAGFSVVAIAIGMGGTTGAALFEAATSDISEDAPSTVILLAHHKDKHNSDGNNGNAGGL